MSSSRTIQVLVRLDRTDSTSRLATDPITVQGSLTTFSSLAATDVARLGAIAAAQAANASSLTGTAAATGLRLKFFNLQFDPFVPSAGAANAPAQIDAVVTRLQIGSAASDSLYPDGSRSATLSSPLQFTTPAGRLPGGVAGNQATACQFWDPSILSYRCGGKECPVS